MTALHRLFVALLALAASCETALAAEAPKTQVVLVGTYHFSNPGKDLNNVKAVDILAICARLLQELQPGDRVVVFYDLLQQCLREQPNVQLVDPLMATALNERDPAAARALLADLAAVQPLITASK